MLNILIGEIIMGRMSDLHIQMTEDGFFDEQNDPSPDEMNGFVDNKDLSDKDDISIDDFSHNIKEFVDNYKPVTNSFKQIFKGE